MTTNTTIYAQTLAAHGYEVSTTTQENTTTIQGHHQGFTITVAIPEHSEEITVTITQYDFDASILQQEEHTITTIHEFTQLI